MSKALVLSAVGVVVAAALQVYLVGVIAVGMAEHVADRVK